MAPIAPSTSIEDLHPELLTRTLRLLDPPSLASASSSSSLLRSLSSQSHLWLHLSLSTFPSLNHPLTLPFLSSSPRSFFSHAFPFPLPPSPPLSPLPLSLLSSVDIHHRSSHLLSSVIHTHTSSPWFRASPFFIHAILPKPDVPSKLLISPDDLTLSWILIDSASGRAVNVSSRRPVAVERNCYTGETMVRFALVAAEGERVVAAVVTCGEEMGRVREVMLTVEDIDGACVSGEEALEIVGGMMEAGRKGGEEDEAKRRYQDFVRRKRVRKESVARREGVLDLCCTAVGVFVFLAFLLVLVLR